jgi:predicted Zn-dependent peptidase
MPMNYFDITVQNIKSTTAEELQQLAKKYLNPENFYELQVV